MPIRSKNTRRRERVQRIYKNIRETSDQVGSKHGYDRRWNDTMTGTGWIDKHLIIGERMLKLMEKIWSRTDKAKQSLVGYDLIDTGVNWDNMTTASKIETVKNFINREYPESCGLVALEQDEVHKSWNKDQNAWVKRTIRDLKAQGPFFPKGCIFEAVSIEDKGKKNIAISDSRWPVTLEELSLGMKLNTSANLWSWDNERRAEEYHSSIIVDANFPMFSLGEYIVMGEIEGAIRFLRVIRFLCTASLQKPLNEGWTKNQICGGFLFYNAFQSKADIAKARIQDSNYIGLHLIKPSSSSNELKFYLPQPGKLKAKLLEEQEKTANMAGTRVINTRLEYVQKYYLTLQEDFFKQWQKEVERA